MGAHIMQRAFLSKGMNSLKKRAGLLILCLTAILFACGEQNKGMLSIASEDVPMIYAIADINSEAVLIVTNFEGYYREYTITGAAPPSTSDVICASRSGRVYVSDSTNWYIFSSSGSDYSSWSYQAMGSLTLGIVSTPFGDYCMQDNLLNLLYRYEESSNSWQSMGKATTGNDPEKMCYSSTFCKIYINDNDAAGTYILELGTPSTLIPVTHYSIGTFPRNFLAEVDGGIYLGDNTQGLFLKGALIGSGSGLQSYVVVSPTEIFAGNDFNSLPLRLFRLTGTTFVPELYFTSTAGTIKLWPMPPDHIIIGISGSGVNRSDGLYVYNFRKRNLRILNTRSIIALCARQQ